jgi:predicted ATPase/DNA-binding CsgD family transcriptional regulator/Tfp pilus assembly protein PilF
LGRGGDISKVRDLLQASRLVTLTGAPGVGKTRLALEVAGAPGEPGERTALVELAPIGDPSLLPRAVAAVLSVQEVAGSTLTEALVARLRRRRMLLVLDNCEHLLGACADIVGALLGGCPHLRILATSREPLSVAGERVWHVPPLSVPGPREEPRPEALMSYEGVRLFVERAEAVQPDFVLSGEVSQAVAEITWRLDGIPLAIELAATRVEALTPAEIARRLDDRFALLTKGARNGLPRHQTLQAALDWSHELLSSPERALLRRLSAFVGGFCLEAAESVCTGEELQAAEVFDLLAGLVSKSLVVSDTVNARGRYRMLETIRAYAADRVEEAGEAPGLGRAHAQFYLGLAERAEPELTGADQERWFERLDSEHENLRFALLWSLGHRQIEWALRLAGALVLFWRVRCYFSEGRELLEATVHASDAKGDLSGLRAKALWGMGFMALMAGDAKGAGPPLEQSLSDWRQLDDLQGSARALLILGNAHIVLGYPSAPLLIDESADLARKAGDRWCLAHALGLKGYAHLAHNDLAAGRPLFEECLAVAREATDKQGLRFGLIGLGRVAIKQGDYGSAESLLRETLSIAGELGEAYIEASARQDLGELALGRGEYARARCLFEEAQAVLPVLAPVDAVVGPLLGLARVAHVEGDPARARLLVEEALATIPPPGTSIPALHHLGELAAEEGDAGRARRLFQDALEWARSSGDKWLTARSLHGLGELMRAAEDVKRATGLHVEALELQRQLGDKPGIGASLEALAGLATASGRQQHAARLLGAAEALRTRGGYARLSWESRRHEGDLKATREGLSGDDLEAAFAEGMRLSIEEAMTQAAKGRRRRGRAAAGWESLTETEQQLTALVAQGLTNREIAQRQLISPGTVKAHLSTVFSKLGVAGRRELAREAWRRHQQGPGAEARSSRE